MKTRLLLPALVLALAVIFAACSPQPAPTDVVPNQSDTMEDEMMEEEGEMTESDDTMMEESEDEMMDEGDAMAESEDDAMMDEEGEEKMEDEMPTTTFVVRIENISSEDGLTILAPGAYELNDHPVSFFTPGEADRGEGLEALAEDGDPSVLVESINSMMGEEMMGFTTGVFNTPAGADAAGPVGPGAAYEFVVAAYPGQYLTFATMFVQSNDWFFAPDEMGIALFDTADNPISGDITDLVFLWNAGTEVDQTPGEGADQAPRQAGPNTGEDENGLVSLVEDFSDYQILVSITPQQ